MRTWNWIGWLTLAACAGPTAGQWLRRPAQPLAVAAAAEPWCEWVGDAVAYRAVRQRLGVAAADWRLDDVCFASEAVVVVLLPCRSIVTAWGEEEGVALLTLTPGAAVAGEWFAHAFVVPSGDIELAVVWQDGAAGGERTLAVFAPH